MTNKSITIHVPAVPVAQPRPRASSFGGSARVHEVTHIKQADGRRKPHPIAAFKAAVMMSAQKAYSGPPLSVALYCKIVCVLPRPKNKIWKTKPMPRYAHTSKPDCDNLAKSVLDALSGIIWTDDSVVSMLLVTKNVASGDEPPHVVIEVWEI